MEKYNQSSRGQLIQKIEFLKSENKFLKECLRGTKEFKELKEQFDKWIENEFGGTNRRKGSIMAQRYCNRCGARVKDADYKSDNDYNYYCPNCDEDLYTFETHEEL